MVTTGSLQVCSILQMHPQPLQPTRGLEALQNAMYIHHRGEAQGRIHRLRSECACATVELHIVRQSHC
jgi:hypothetical protein